MMLQTNSVRNLQYDSDLRIAQPPMPIEPVVYQSNQSIVSSYGATQNVSTVESTTASSSTLASYLPKGGITLLNEIPSCHIHQVFELNDSIRIASENRFTVKTPLNDSLFLASEGSTQRDRLLWGSSRSFLMHLMDRQHQETLTFRRVSGCRMFCLPIFRQSLEVWLTPGILLGVIQENFKLNHRDFSIESERGEVLYHVSISLGSSICMPREYHFRVLTADKTQQMATLTRLWNTDLNAYTMNIYFAEPTMDAKVKALILGLAFLLEYLYFQSKSCC